MTRNTGPYLLLQWPLGGRFSIPPLISIIQRPCESSLCLDQLNLLNPHRFWSNQTPKESHQVMSHLAIQQRLDELFILCFQMMKVLDVCGGFNPWDEEVDHWNGPAKQGQCCIENLMKSYDIELRLVLYPIGSMYAIYGNMDPTNIPPMWAYMPAPWILWVWKIRNPWKWKSETKTRAFQEEYDASSDVPSSKGAPAPGWRGKLAQNTEQTNIQVIIVKYYYIYKCLSIYYIPITYYTIK